MASAMTNHWIVGSTFNRSEDQKDRFLAEGVWEIDNPSASDKQLVLAMQPGGHIAIKSTFVQKYGLPFNNHGKPVSVLRLKARGTITANPDDGQRVYVNWDTGFSQRDWYFFTYRATIWQLEADGEEARRLIRFIWDDEPQDYAWFLNDELLPVSRTRR